MQQKIGIFGGSFDPIHKGHLQIAQAAKTQLDLDYVYFVPAGNPPHKDGADYTAAEHRVEMISRAIENLPYAAISEWELQSDTIGYTYLTLQHFRAEHPYAALYFLLGADSLRDFSSWRHPEMISELATLVVLQREELDIAELQQMAQVLRDRFGTRVEILNAPGVLAASHTIRARLLRGEDCTDVVPNKVLTYMKENDIYGA